MMTMSECMTNAHKNIIFFSHLSSVVAQSYKIDVEILAAPRGITRLLKIKIIYG